jgi:hypothetical protein
MNLKNRKEKMKFDRLARFAKDYQPGNPIKPNFKFRAEAISDNPTDQNSRGPLYEPILLKQDISTYKKMINSAGHGAEFWSLNHAIMRAQCDLNRERQINASRSAESSFDEQTKPAPENPQIFMGGIISFEEASRIMEEPIERKFFKDIAKPCMGYEYMSTNEIQNIDAMNRHIEAAKSRGNVLTFLEMPADRHGFPMEILTAEIEKFLECNSIDPDSDPC